MATGQSADLGASTVSNAPWRLAAIAAAALLAGSMIGAGVVSFASTPASHAISPTRAAAVEQVLAAVRAGERASGSADTVSLHARLADVEPALAGIRADERSSEIPLDVALAQIRAGERAPLDR